MLYHGPPDHFVVELGRVVQPGDEIAVEKDVADRLASAWGFSVKGKKRTEKVVEPHSERHVGAPS